MNGACVECGGWVPGDDETGYVDDFCSQSCIDQYEAHRALEDEDDDQRREFESQKAYQ